MDPEILQCRQPVLPYTSLCSGFGQCVVTDAATGASHCVCEPNYSGLGYFFDFGTTDCAFNQLAFLVLLCVAYASCILATIVALARLITLGFICSRDSRLNQRQVGKKRLQQLVLSQLLASYMMMLHFGFMLLFNLYPHNSVVSAIVSALALTVMNVEAYFRGLYFASIHLRSSRLVSFEGVLSRMNTFLAAITVISIAGDIVTVIPHAFGNIDSKIHWHIGMQCKQIGVNIIWSAFNSWCYPGLVRTIDDHIQRFQSSDLRGYDTEKLQKTRARLAKLVPTQIITPLLPVVLSVLASIFLTASTYYFPAAVLIFNANTIVFLSQIDPKASSGDDSWGDNTQAHGTREEGSTPTLQPVRQPETAALGFPIRT